MLNFRKIIEDVKNFTKPLTNDTSVISQFFRPLSFKDTAKDFSKGLLKGVGELATSSGYLADLVTGVKVPSALTPEQIEQQKQILRPTNIVQKFAHVLGSLSPGAEVVQPALKKIGVPTPLAFGIGLGVDILTPGLGEAGGVRKLDDLAKEARKYPMANIDEWYGEANYKASGGKLVSMTPDEFLSKSKSLKIDKIARENIDDLKKHIQGGKTLDPLTIYDLDKTKVRGTDGRHRAIAAKELGIGKVPVIDYTQAIGGVKPKEVKVEPNPTVSKDIQPLAREAQTLRGTKGMTATDIMKTYPDIKLTRDIPATDIYGNKVKIPDGEVLTPYELKGNKVLLQDGETYIVSKNQYQNIKGNAVSAEAKEFAPELKRTEETIKTDNTPARDKLYAQADAGEITTAQRNAGIDKLGVPNKTKYSQYQLPGGRDYREIIIKAPLEKGKTTEWIKSSNGDLNATINGTGVTITKEGSKFYVYEKGGQLGQTMDTEVGARRIAENYAKDKGPSGFKSSHWPDELNPISHIRRKIYDDPKYKEVYFVEELQSDWAREGRAKGFATEITKDTAKQQGFLVYKAKSSTGGEAYFINNETDPYFHRKGFTNTGFDTEAEAWNNVIKKLKETSGAIPNNPLLKNWQELSIKRALKDAVDSNAEYFSWTTGEQQTARYGTDAYSWKKKPNGTYEIKHTDQLGGNAAGIDIENEGRIRGLLNEGKIVNAKSVEDLRGAFKDKAEKVWVKIQTANEGVSMPRKEFYENLYGKEKGSGDVGNIVSDLTGARVEKLDLGLPIEKTNKTFNFSPNRGELEQLTEKNIKKGLELSGDGDTWIITDNLNGGKFRAVRSKDYRDLLTYKNEKKIHFDNRLFPDYETALNHYKKEFDISTKKTTQQGIRLTPEIKAKIRGEAPDFKTSGKQYNEIKSQINQMWDDINSGHIKREELNKLELKSLYKKRSLIKDIDKWSDELKVTKNDIKKKILINKIKENTDNLINKI